MNVLAVREESQLDDMRSAIRGDFERLERRRGAQELMQVRAESPDTAPRPETEPVAATPSEREPEQAPVEGRRSWLARIFQP